MSDQRASDTNDSNNQPVIGLPGDERDILISRVIDGVATSNDWTIFRALAAHDPSIWTELADTQRIQETMYNHIDYLTSIADGVELPGGLIDDQPMRRRLDMISKWGGWAAAAAILVVWFFGNPSLQSSNEIMPATAGFGGSNLLLDQAQPEQAFDQYLASGQSSGQVIGEMPEHIVIETRPMPDGSIEVLYLRQIIERQIIDHAYRETRDEAGNVFPVPVKLSPRTTNSF